MHFWIFVNSSDTTKFQVVNLTQKEVHRKTFKMVLDIVTLTEGEGHRTDLTFCNQLNHGRPPTQPFDQMFLNP